MIHNLPKVDNKPEKMTDNRDNPPTESKVGIDFTITWGGRVPLLDPVCMAQITSSYGMYRKLALTSLSIPDYRTPMVTYDQRLVITAGMFCQARLNMYSEGSSIRGAVLLVDEIAASFLPCANYLSTADADAEFLKVCQLMFTTPALRDLAPLITADKYGRKPEAEGVPGTRHGLPALYPFAMDSVKDLSVENVHRLLNILSTFTDNADPDRTAIEILANLIVSISKQGTVSSQFTEKVRNDIRAQLRKEIRISAEVVSAIWGAYGQYINETNVGPLMYYLLNNIMSDATRLRITVIQSKYHALTMYQTIGRAVLKHPSFNWSVVEKIAPGELTTYNQCLTTIDKNAYYGFSHDLEKFKAKKYRTLGYIAKELLVKQNSETHLNQNKMFSIKPAKQPLIDKLIGLYVDHVTAISESSILEPNKPVPTRIIYGIPTEGLGQELVRHVNELSTCFQD